MKQQRTYTVEEAKNLLEHFCAYQERSHRDVEQKLRDLNMIPAAQEKIILHLIQENYLNEERYAKTFARGKFSIKKWGRRKIVNALKMNGISEYNIKIALREIDENDYLNTLEALADKKEATLKDSNKFSRLKKLQTYLIGRGFEPELVYKMTNNHF